MSDGRARRCPRCHESDGLWQEVTVDGWRAIDAYLKPTGTVESMGHVISVEQQGGCSCGWEGSFRDLEIVGIDGEPLPTVHPDQLQIDAA